eukprot:7627713-Prorocentrum_lima.AAC.1
MEGKVAKSVAKRSLDEATQLSEEGPVLTIEDWLTRLAKNSHKFQELVMAAHPTRRTLNTRLKAPAPF